MSYRDCILSNIKSGLIDEKDGEAFLREYDDLVGGGASNAGEKLFKQRAERLIKEKINFQKTVKKIQEFRTEIDSKDITGALKFVQQKAQQVQSIKSRVENQTIDIFAAELEKGGVTKKHINSPEYWDAVSDVIEDGVEASSKEVAAGANAVKAYRRFTHAEAELAGSIKGNLGENSLPRSFNTKKVRDFTPEEFSEEFLPLVDFGDSKLTLGEKIDLVEGVRRDVLTSGLSSRKRKRGQTESAGEDVNPRDIDARRDLARKFKIKKGQSRNFRALFGEENVFQSIRQDIIGTASDIGLLETYGPKSIEAFESIQADLDIKLGLGKPSLLDKGRARSIKDAFDSQTGRAFDGDPDNVFLVAQEGLQALQRASQLGSTLVSAIPDVSFVGLTAKKGGSASGFSDGIKVGLGTALRGLKNSPEVLKIVGRASDEAILVKELLHGSTRFDFGSERSGVAKSLSDSVFKVQGLNRWTRAQRNNANAFAQTGLFEQLDNVKKFSDLDDQVRETFESSGFTSKDWDQLTGVIDKHSVQIKNSIKTLNTRAIRLDPDIPNAHGLANKLENHYIAMEDLALNENNVFVKSITGARKTPTGKIAAKTVLQYKNWVTSMTFNHLFPAIKRASTGKGTEDLAFLLISTGILGIGTHQASEILNGREPKEFGPELIKEGILRGGGLGHLADLTIRDTTQFGRNSSSLLFGPSGQFVFDSVDLGNGVIHDSTKSNVKRAKKLAKGLIPFKNLWYTKLLASRLIGDNLERMFDDDFDRSIMEVKEKTKTRTGQDFWWNPGSNTPE